MTTIRFPNVLAAVKAWEENKHEMADALVVDLGEPPKSFAECQRRIEAGYPEGLFDNYGGVKRAAMMWRVADAFPVKMRRRYGLDLCAAAGDPTTLEAAANYAKTSGKTLNVKLIKLTQQAMAIQSDEEGYLRKRKLKNVRLAREPEDAS